MRIAIISDIHANLEALERVLEDIQARQASRILCLGDSIGYGPEPEAVLQRLRRERIPQVQGNHERAVIVPKDRCWFNPNAREALVITEKLLSDDSRAWLPGLPLTFIQPGLYGVHGCPPESVRRYLFSLSDRQLRQVFQGLENRVCFVGHTHLLHHVTFDGEQLHRQDLTEGQYWLDPACQHIVNVGSVGQPRDGDSRSKYVLWEPDHRLLTVRCVHYDIAVTAKAILALGLPEQYARVLWQNSPTT